VNRGAVVALVPALLYLVTAFYVGSIDQDPLAVVQFHWKDKLLHALFFGVMQRTHYRAFEYLRPGAAPRTISVWAFMTAAAAGILLEVWQAFLPHRTAELWDAIADAVGAALFAWLFLHLGTARRARA